MFSNKLFSTSKLRIYLNYMKSLIKKNYTTNHEESKGRHEYHEDIECAMNKQIATELNASLAYLSMSCYFGRSDIAYPGCQGYFYNMYKEETDHANEFINYQLTRGGVIQLFPLTTPEEQDWECILKALDVALDMEKLVKEKLVKLYEMAEKHQDLQTMDLISTKYMEEQNKSICELARLHARASRLSDNIGQFLFDKEMHTAFVRKVDKKDTYK